MNGPKDPVTGQWPTCPVCGSVLWVGLATTAVYCSGACRSKAYRLRRRAREPEAWLGELEASSLP